MSRNATQQLLDTLADAGASEEQVKSATQALFAALQGSMSLAEANAAVQRLSAAFALPDPARAGVAAMVCGVLAEHGVDGSLFARPLFDRLKPLLEASAELHAACDARIEWPQQGEEIAGDDQQDDEEDEFDPCEAFEAARAEVAAEMPQQNAAWDALERFWPPAIAVLSASPALRAAARPLAEPAAAISDFNEAGHWLRQMLAVLDDEPILVIEPESKTGVAGTISGVADNFQLNMLLMDAFPRRGWFRRRRIPRRVAEVARGRGPQSTDDVVTGTWNLYTWQAIGRDLSLPDPNDYGRGEVWIWNEGIPADIPTFAGYRVVLLGPPSYPRSWPAQRTFADLPAELKCDTTLTPQATDDWLRRMAAGRTG